jgi:iron(III) transport system ATP-binding protein
MNAPATPPASGHFEVRNLTKVFQTDDGPVTAVQDVNFSIMGDMFFTMLGPSGCGKTTTLRMIAGLETVSSGEILQDGSDFRKMNAFQRNIGMVFQSYALFPHMTVFENAAYGLRLRGAPEDKVRGGVKRVLEMLRLDGLAHRFPADLSGGQQQRVSIARALVYEPGMLLLDEPLANLDAKLRVEMRDEIRRLQKALGVKALYVTHDQEEAMAISDQIAVFSKGRLIQIGPPFEIYARPASLFVADFIGKANFLPCHIGPQTGGAAACTLAGGAVFEGVPLRPAIAGEEDWFTAGLPGLMMARPEKLWIKRADAAPDAPQGRALRIQFLGSFVRYMVESADARGPVIIDAPGFAEGVAEGDAVAFGLSAADATVFTAAGAQA